MPSVIKGFTQRALRWPLLFAVVLILAFELFWYCVIRLCVISYEWFCNIHTRNGDIKRRMRDATTFVEWCRAARELDQVEGRDKWKLDPAWPYYDPDLLTSHLSSLRRHRSSNDHRSLMRNLKTIYSLYNFGGMSNYQLYNQSQPHYTLATSTRCCQHIQPPTTLAITYFTPVLTLSFSPILCLLQLISAPSCWYTTSYRRCSSVPYSYATTAAFPLPRDVSGSGG